MAQADSDHKNALRLSSIAQYLAGSVNRLRFLPIGRDTRGNTYYILSSTPGRAYPNESSELAYAWSYNLLMHGSEPSDMVHPSRKPAVGTSEKAQSEELIDMLEGGQRDLDDQWMRISDPDEIRKLGAWIEYEARLIEYRQLESINEDSITDENGVALGVKNVGGLVEQIYTFAEYLDLKINEAADELVGKRSAVKSRNNATSATATRPCL